VALLMQVWFQQRVLVRPNAPAKDAAWANRMTSLLRWLIYDEMEECEDEAEYLANLLVERGLSGLDLQAELTTRNIHTPIVFITGHGDIPTSVRAMKAGAVDFLTKPFRHKDLIAVIQDALSKDIRLKSVQGERETIQRHLQSLTPRERQVFELVIKGLLNKQIAAELGASEQTIKVHQGQVMEKMEVPSVAELVQAAVKAGALKT
jgi:RNA polymerase sigma factor (sigma-70 family)